jgi:Xaa-Pro aminopeptidase
MSDSATKKSARIMAGPSSTNRALFHQIRFAVGDPAALVIWPDGKRLFLVRDIEMERAKRAARADRVACPAEFTPAGGLSGDRETATAQSLAECMVRSGLKTVVADRTLPLIYVHHLQERGVAVVCDPEMGVADRRQKDAQEIHWLQESQGATEQAIRVACEMIARASVDKSGCLMHQGEPLTSERVRFEIDVFLLRHGFINHDSIVAGGPRGADCHDRGTGPLRTSEPVIVDVFPQSRSTQYYGDCTRTVVNGEIPPEIGRMHEVVLEAKRAAIAACRAGVTGEDIHQSAISVIQRHGYQSGLPPENAPDSYCAMTHGTGHGIGLDVHEPPLLDKNGPILLVGDALTIEPGLYCRALGGIRVEDMVIVREDGCDNLNQLPEGLVWN